MAIEIKEMPEFRVFTVPHTGPYPTIPKAFERLTSLAGPAGLFERPGAAMMAIYHDDPDSTPPEKLRSAAAIAVSEKEPLLDGLVEARLPAGKYACTLHIGPYEKLGDAWQRLKSEFGAKGYRMGHPSSYEIYRNTPMEVPKEELRTELYMSLT
ncbi:MAG TPA: GyrI-like domain-containing protein [Polyangiaceae bacterium]|nr:GyrI-like domain-containing protein [Polyangiaceae bacterium]